MKSAILLWKLLAVWGQHASWQNQYCIYLSCCIWLTCPFCIHRPSISQPSTSGSCVCYGGPSTQAPPSKPAPIIEVLPGIDYKDPCPPRSCSETNDWTWSLEHCPRSQHERFKLWMSHNFPKFFRVKFLNEICKFHLIAWTSHQTFKQGYIENALRVIL
jgi:hypothetical protein